MIGKTFSTPSPGSRASVRPGPLLAERGDDRLVRSVDHLGLQPQRGDVTRHVLDLQGRCVRFHDNDHGRPPSLALEIFEVLSWSP